MSFQYLHTSAKRGLEPGRSGFCCVARDRALPPDLITELESQSRYSADQNGAAPLVLRHRIATLRSGTYHILSRIQESGTDYSKRNNHIAHHLVFPSANISGLPTPASILLNWRGWRRQWDQPPRILEATEAFDLQDLDSSWNARRAANAFDTVAISQNPEQRAFEISLQEERNLIEHFRRTLNTLPIGQRWDHPFTSCLLPTDQPQDYAWFGLIDSLPLPYEIDRAPRSAKTANNADRDLSPKPPQPTPQTQSPPPSEKKFKAPVVEIPDDYDHRKRKRPRRRFGRKELSRAINIAIAGGALICIALLLFFLRSHKSSSLAHPDSNATALAQRSLQARQAVWQRFAESGYPRAELEPARATAAFLAKTGEDMPLRTIAFIEQILAASPSDFAHGIAVPKHLIQLEGESRKLPLSPISYPTLSRLALLPAAAASKLDFPALDQRLAPLSAMPQAAFSPTALASSLEAYLLQADSAYAALPATTRQAMESYLQQVRSIKENTQFASVLRLAERIGLDPSRAYLAFRPQGQLLSSSPQSLAQHLRELSSYLFAQSKDIALQSSVVQAAWARIQNEDTESALQVAAAVQDALDTLNLDARSNDDPLVRIRTLWSQTFIRPDLMEQTILGYTLEDLEAQKLRLIETRSQFGPQELDLHLARQNRAQKVAALQQAAIEAASSKEWIVISKQSTKSPHFLP